MKQLPTKTENILRLMKIVAWLAFVGFMIEAGGLVVSFVVSCINPAAVKNLYNKTDFHILWQFSFACYSLLMAMLIGLMLIKAYVWYLVIKTLSGLTLANPFTMEVVQTLEKISYFLFGGWIVGLMSTAFTEWLQKQTGELFENGAAKEFLFMAGLVFVISQIFKRGLEIQSEHELTV